MKTDQLLNQILPILHSVKDDEEKLQQILDFLLEEIYEEPDDEMVIPDKYRKLVHDVAESIDCGMICFINPETLEMEDIPKTLLDEGFIFDEEEDDEEDDEGNMMSIKHHQWENCITVEPPESSESFRIMEDFVSEIDDKKLQKQLINALSHRRPFANFKHMVEGSQSREEWFAFKRHKLEEYVWRDLSWELEKKTL